MRSLGARQISAWIGPHICGGCYEVPQAMWDDVVARHPAAASTTSWGTPALDLGAGVAAQLAQEGVASERVEVCTFESADHHSYRRDGLAAGRLAAFIWLE
ncbi:mannose-6-phosphate isomerase 1-like [Platysternon megacephalum]|uniref:Mannose-6-phosphate isomerase 1-like n=1 Tax=Platysternon megacephalum TaxID=55544 RepID=A0A4D9DCX3_9SAUR|nr:mannose-6-phosphate isomerase 1-like [Platysternon megacephalum]